MIFLRALWGRAWPYIATAASIIAGLFYVRQSGKAAGKHEARVDQLEADQKAVEQARNVENETAAMGDDAVARESMDKWVRDNRR